MSKKNQHILLALAAGLLLAFVVPLFLDIQPLWIAVTGGIYAALTWVFTEVFNA